MVHAEVAAAIEVATAVVDEVEIVVGSVEAQAKAVIVKVATGIVADEISQIVFHFGFKCAETSFLKRSPFLILYALNCDNR